MAVKYKQYYKEMRAKHEAEFAQFAQIHEKFGADRMKYQDEFNQVGSQIQDIVQDWEKRLCSRMEGGKNGNYSANLAEKFKGEIRADFPHYDLIGVKLILAD